MANHFLVVLIIAISAVGQIKSQQQDKFECGVPKMTKSDAILHGHPTVPGSWPWHAAIFHTSITRTGLSTSYACGGTLISRQFVLTAAHCTKSDNGNVLNSKLILVKLGLHNLLEPNSQSLQTHNVLEVHQFKDQLLPQHYKNDIALIELKTAADFTRFVQPACISMEKDLVGQNGTVPGWGYYTQVDDLSPVLQVTELPVVDTMDCLESDRSLFGPTLDRTVFCAGFDNGTGVCNGDSGGGLVFRKGNAWHLGGIVSFTGTREYNSQLCRTHGLAGFTKVHYFLPWIRDKTNLASLQEPRNATCEDSEKKMRFPRHCGPFSQSFNATSRTAQLYEFPWAAKLYYETVGEFLCPGSLISKRYVITWAACVRRYKPTSVRLGDYDINQDVDCDSEGCAPPVLDIEVQCVKIHPSFSPRSPNHNIALVRLLQDVAFDDHIQPICLPVTAELRSLQLQNYIRVSRLAESSSLQKVTVSTDRPSTCAQIYNGRRYNFDSNNTLCIKSHRDIDACGDSLGILINNAFHNGMCRYVLFGSEGVSPGCAAGIPSIYTKISFNMDWVTSSHV